MRQSIKSKKSATATASRESSRTLVLAGLGAMSLLQKQGRKAYDALVAEGLGFRNRSRKYVKTVNGDARRIGGSVRKQIVAYVAPLQAKAKTNVARFEAAVTERIGAVLGRFGVPSKGDVQELLARVAELNKEIKDSTRRAAR